MATLSFLSFHGGVGTVTGSKYLLKAGGRHILIDCGLFQGLKSLRERNWQTPGFDPRELDAVLLTHAHIDHTGYLPRLVAEGYEGPVYCSRGTADLLRILLLDAARLQEEDADYRNRHGLTHHAPARPLYTEADAERALHLLYPVSSSEANIEIEPGISAQFFNAGHILGSRFVRVDVAGAGQDGRGRSILFSGDLGRSSQPILRDLVPPPASDYLLVESTYGDRMHTREDVRSGLARVINQAATRNAPLLIPAFAIGRTQELIYHIRALEDEGHIPILPVYADSPMAEAATQVYLRRVEEQDEEFLALRTGHRGPLTTHNMAHTSRREDSRRLNAIKGACILLSAAGMMTGGRVLHHAMRILPDPNATILFVGFQAAGTTGRRIKEGEREVKIHKQWFPVKCHVESLDGFSSHADSKEILDWLDRLPEPPRRIFLTHGEPEAAEALRTRIVERFGWSVTIPQYLDRVELV